MAAVTIRNLKPETHRAIKARAKTNGRSAEAEMRAILDASVSTEEPLKLGTALAAFGRKYRKELSQIDFDSLRDKSEIEPAVFE
jgi:plasmid stability protein